MRRLPGSVISLAAGLTLFAACSYSPQLTSGELRCSAQRECPHGYSCSASNFCCADGDMVCNGSGSSGRAADFIGTWTFGSTAMVLTECEDGTSGTNMLAKTTLAITAGAGGGTALTANWSVWQSYGCPTTIPLFYDATGAHLADTSWFCEDDTQGLTDYWEANAFDITLLNATTGTHNGLYYLEETQNGTTVVCQQTVTATLTKAK